VGLTVSASAGVFHAARHEVFPDVDDGLGDGADLGVAYGLRLDPDPLPQCH
jgi:hypothetical protein